MSASNPSDDTYVLSDLDDVGVLTLTLNRPDVLNAWIPLMQTALFDAMDAATEDPHVRVIVLTGAGRGFCPGADMQHLASLAEGSQVSFAAMKWQLARTPFQTPDDALRDANRLMRQTTQGPDFAEGVKAFTGRRDPSFAPLGHGSIVEYPAD